MDLKNTGEYALFSLVFTALRVLPYRWSVTILRRLGRLAASTTWGRGTVVKDQLALTYPNLGSLELEDLMKQVYDHLALTVAEVFCADMDRLLPSVEVVPGWRELEEALAKGRGVIVATGHIGNFELGGAVLANRYPVLDVVKTQRNLLFDSYLEAMRKEHGIQTVPMQAAGPAVLKQLRRGGLVTLLMDQDAGSEGTQINFLRRPASTWPGAARLSLRTGAPVVPMAMRRLADGSHRLCIGQTLTPEQYQDTPEGVRNFLNDISRQVEAYIDSEPSQWFWVHRRWKNCMEAG